MTDHSTTYAAMRLDGLPEHFIQAVATLVRRRGPTSGVNNLLQLWLIVELAERLEIEEALQVYCNEEFTKQNLGEDLP